MSKNDIEKDLIEDLKLGRGFYTELEHLIMSLMNTNEKLLKISNEFLLNFNITETQFNALMSLAEYYNYHGKALNQKELADRLLIKKASVGTLIERLSKNGWVEVKPSEEDKRAKNVFITQKGLNKYKEVFEPYYLFMGPLILDISPEDFSATLRVLNQIRNNLNKLG